MRSGRFSSDAVRAAGFLAALGTIVLLSRVTLFGKEVSTVVSYAADVGLNAVDERLMVVRYYESLGPPADTDEAVARLTVGFSDRKSGEAMVNRLDKGEWFLPHRESEFLLRDLKPNYDGSMKGMHVTTNQWGMRDRDYDKQKPERTFRMALLGGSNSMGQGVDYEEAYATIAEELLNEELSGEGYDAYEILNFAITAQFLPSRLWIMEQRAESFDPDLILLVILPSDRTLVHNVMGKRLFAKPSFEALHFDFLKQAVTEAGITTSDFTDNDIMARKLQGHRDSLLVGALAHAARFSKRSGIPVVGLVLDLKRGRGRRQKEIVGDLADIAESAGLLVLRVFDALRDLSPREAYQIPGRNNHATPLAHRLMAEELVDQMMSHDTIRGMLLNEPPDQPAGAP